MVVVGDLEARHGIVLTARYIAKKEKLAWHCGRRKQSVRILFLLHRGWTYIFDFQRGQERYIVSIPTCKGRLVWMSRG